MVQDIYIILRDELPDVPKEVLMEVASKVFLGLCREGWALAHYA